MEMEKRVGRIFWKKEKKKRRQITEEEKERRNLPLVLEVPVVHAGLGLLVLPVK